MRLYCKVVVMLFVVSDDVPNYDVVVIGAGLIGMATAQELITRHPSLTYCVVEKENKVGQLISKFFDYYQLQLLPADER